MKLLIVLPNFRGGGAERLAINLANDWQARGFCVEFILLEKEGELISFVSSNIKLVDLNCKRIRHAIWPLATYLKRCKPDVIWVGMWPLTSAAIISWILAGRTGKIFVTDHVQLSISCLRELKIPTLCLKLIMSATYRFATGVTAVSKGVAFDIAKLAVQDVGKIRVIYNPAATGVPAERAPLRLREKLWGAGWDTHILTIGSLKAQKNHAMLIRAFAKVTKKLNAKLIILGEGYLRPSLEHQVSALGLTGKVNLPGFQPDPYPWLRSADLFVFSSDWEGFGNVLVEALECGVPIVSTNCRSGPDEILDDGRFGRLVPVGDEEAFARATIETSTQVHDRHALIARAKEFSVEKISVQYLDYFGLPHSV